MIPSTSWLYAVPSIITPVFLLAALIYVSLRRGDGSNSKAFAIVGLGTFLILNVINQLSAVIIGRLVISSDFAPIYSVYLVFAAFLSMAGYACLIAAVFAGRKSNASDISRDFGGAGVSNENPYSASSL